MPNPLRIALLTYSTKPRGGVVHTLALAEALARQPESAETKTVAPRSSTATTPRASGHPGYLSSWLLAKV